MASPTPTLVWFRDDLRVLDNPALSWAAQQGPIIGVYIHETVGRPLGAATRWWLAQSLEQLRSQLGAPLLELQGNPRVLIPQLAQGKQVVWNRRYRLTDIDAHIKQQTNAKTFAGALLTEPWQLRTGSGTPYKVFTPFYKRLQQHLLEHPPQPLPAPTITAADAAPQRVAYHAPEWAAKLAQHNTPGEQAALDTFHGFLDLLADAHTYNNDDLTHHATSGLSAHLRFGELSPGYVWAETAQFAETHPMAAPSAWAFLRQLGWREFAWHRLYHLPDLATVNVRKQFDHFDWAWQDSGDTDHLEQLQQWQKGTTGIPLVDAGMRQLWETGRMHNRVRMVAGSWLTKNLGIHWRHGEEWFWDTLVDADHAANPFNWQWVAGSGDDAAPYFRVFNPLTQQEKFDPQGRYVRRWVPEALTPLYPAPMVDVKASRQAALDTYQDMLRKTR